MIVIVKFVNSWYHNTSKIKNIMDVDDINISEKSEYLYEHWTAFTP